MDVNPSAPVADLDAMSQRLAEMEAAQAASESGASTTPAPKPAASTTDAGNRAPAADGQTTEKSTNSPSSSTPSGPSGQAPKEAPGQSGGDQQQQQQQLQQQQPPKPGEQQQAKGSPYKQDSERRDRSWKELNAQKDVLAKEREAFTKEATTAKAALQSERDAFNAERSKYQSDNSPDAFDKYAQAENGKAQKLEALAKQAEDNGDLDKAEELKQAALMARGFERLAKQKAEHLRKNPPPDAAKIKEQHAANVKEWTLKAATDFPEFGKQGSGVQQQTAAFLQQVAQQWPEAAKLPGLVYFAAERAALKVAADRVPGLEKELGELKKKVTDLEALTSTAPQGGVSKLPASVAKAWDEKSSDEQFAQLRSEAETYGR